jgi:peroxiredoxin
MKGHAFSIITVLLVPAVLWPCSIGAEEKERILSEARGQFGPGRGVLVVPSPEIGFDPGPDMPGRFRPWAFYSLDWISERLAMEREMTTEYEQIIVELKEIRQLALTEKAQKTATRIEALIGKCQTAYQEKKLDAKLSRREFRLMSSDTKPSGKEAPDFTLKSFDGKDFSLAALRGKIVVLEWMNFECPFSKYHYETKTTMSDMAKKYQDKGVVWLAVNSTNHTTPEANMAFAKKSKLPYPILNDIPGKVGKAYGAKTTPHVFVVDRTGLIAYDGAIDNAPLGKIAEGEKYINYVSRVLDALLEGEPVTTRQTKPYGCSVKYAQ